jgi:hypothetical protein
MSTEDLRFFREDAGRIVLSVELRNCLSTTRNRRGCNHAGLLCRTGIPACPSPFWSAKNSPANRTDWKICPTNAGKMPAVPGTDWTVLLRHFLYFAVSTGGNQRLARGWGCHIVAPDDVRKLVKLALARLIDCLVAGDLHVAVILHAGAGRN